MKKLSYFFLFLIFSIMTNPAFTEMYNVEINCPVDSFDFGSYLRLI